MREQPYAHKQIKLCLWIYFWLLIFEGALRKWILPSLSDPLLIVRDPVVLVTYFLALRAGIFPKNGFVGSIAIIGLLSFLTGLVIMLSSEKGNVTIPLFGFRANFLHLPLIFIFPSVMDQSDLVKFGRWVLILSLPMAILMVLQFASGSTGWLTVGAGGGEGGQIVSALGKIRPPGTFSFITGPVFFFSLVSVFLLHGIISRGIYSIFLLIYSGLSLASAMAVSGSRSLLYSVAVVVLMLVVAIACNVRLLQKAYKVVLFVVVVIFTLSMFDFYQEGILVTSTRVESANAQDNPILRVIGGFLDPLHTLLDVPILGYGLGLGTMAGAKLLTGEVGFLLAEGEWARILLESGPILGSVFLIWRTRLATVFFLTAVRHARKMTVLPLLLVGACGLPVVHEQLGQATTAGFTVFIAGLFMVSCKSGSDTRVSRA